MEDFKYKVVLSDIDGVVWRGDKVLWENVSALKLLMEKFNVKIYFTTNNSTKTRANYLKKLLSIGIKTTIDNIITSASLTAEIIRRNYGKVKVYVIGEEGLRTELLLKGISIVKRKKPDMVVVGLDRRITYNKLAKALDFILEGALFIATNTDATLPIGNKVVPGAGAIVAALSKALGRKPDMIVGKPEPWMYLEVLKRADVGKNDVLVIGDRLDTDIKGAMKLGIDSLLVLTGVASKKDLEKSSIKPTYVSNSLKEFILEKKFS